MGTRTEISNKSDRPDGHNREGGNHNPNRRRKLIIAAAIAVVVSVMTGVLMQDDGAQAGKVDLGGKFYVSPGKVYAGLADEPFTAPVTIYNRSGAETFHLVLIAPMRLSPGYEAWDGESYDIEYAATVTVPIGSYVDVPVTITKNAQGGKQEAWLTVLEPDDAGNLKHELVIRILMEG